MGLGNHGKKLMHYYACYGVDLDKSVEILDNNEDLLIERKDLNITPNRIKIIEMWRNGKPKLILFRTRNFGKLKSRVNEYYG